MSTYSWPGVPSLWNLLPDDLRWSWYNKDRNKVPNKWNVLESFQNLPPAPTATLVQGKIVYHETGAWCQNACRPLFWTMQLRTTVDRSWAPQFQILPHFRSNRKEVPPSFEFCLKRLNWHKVNETRRSYSSRMFLYQVVGAEDPVFGTSQHWGQI